MIAVATTFRPGPRGARGANDRVHAAPTPVDGRVPPHDLDAEAAVLSAILLEPNALHKVLENLEAEHFYSEANRRIYEAAVELATDGKPIDIVTVAGVLRDRERFAQVGGSAYLAQLVDSVPSVAHLETYARRVKEKWRVRQLIATCQRVAAEGYGDIGEVQEFIDGALQELGRITDATLGAALPACWMHELGSLSDAPPKTRWFLSDARSGAKLLRLGKCVVLAADGGVGKSFFWLQLAVSVALGRPLFDVFVPEASGYVALLMGEDDAAECRSRLWRICNALKLSDEERDLVSKRLFLFPLAGQEVSLLRIDELKNFRRTEAFDAIIRRLAAEAKRGGFEWLFVGLDPLARFASGSAESDNSEATAFVQTLETIALRVPGEPAIGCTHHASKLSVRAGGADVRGVTGLRNGFRAAFTLAKVKADGIRGVLLENVKNNLAPESDPLWLVQLGNEPMPNGEWLETGGVLAPANEEQVTKLAAASGVATGDPEARRVERETIRESSKVSKAKDRREALLGCLPVEPNFVTSAVAEEALERLGHARQREGVGSELRALVDLGKARDLSDGKGRQRRWCRLSSKDGATS